MAEPEKNEPTHLEIIFRSTFTVAVYLPNE